MDLHRNRGPLSHRPWRFNLLTRQAPHRPNRPVHDCHWLRRGIGKRLRNSPRLPISRLRSPCILHSLQPSDPRRLRLPPRANMFANRRHADDVNDTASFIYTSIRSRKVL